MPGGGFGGKEGGEYLFYVIFRYPGPRILYFQKNPVIRIAQIDGEGTFRRDSGAFLFCCHGIHGVSYDVCECLLQIDRIGQRKHRVFGEILPDFNPGAFRAERREDLLQQILQININQMQFACFRVFMDFIDAGIQFFTTVLCFL